MLLIQNGHLTDPASGIDEARDLLIENGCVKRILKPGTYESGQISPAEGDTLQVIDAAGCIIAPGFVDVHVHFRDPGFTEKEDIETGARSAAAGGFTSVVMMANTKPSIDNVDTLRYCLEKGAKTPIHVYACANITRGMQGKELTDLEGLAAAGAVGFTDDGKPILDEAIMREAMTRAAKLGLPLSFHEEDPQYIENNGINHGKASEYYGIGGSDRMAEITMVERDMKLAAETGVCIDIQHISTKEAVDLVRRARAAGTDAHAEATPHHFALNEEAAIKYGTLAKMNPPLREEADRVGICEGIADGTVDMIATDHAPHTMEEKGRPLTSAPSGIIGLETSLPLAIEYLLNAGYVNRLELIRRLSLTPAELYHLPAGKISEGGPADIVVFDPEETWTGGNWQSKASNSPFTGKELTGRVKYTICDGKIVYKG